MDQDRQGNAKRIKVYIDGPAAILENGTKYGLQLASFFPAILQLQSWKMSSVIKPGTHDLKFILDSKSNLRGHFGNLSAYIPEEIKMFVNHFRQTSDHWKIVPDAPPFLNLGGQAFLFPDLTFSDGGKNSGYPAEIRPGKSKTSRRNHLDRFLRDRLDFSWTDCPGNFRMSGKCRKKALTVQRLF